ncbi:hypothetical protein CYMTET_25716, partial [Cymbomonas tetramitiformis]
MRRSSDLRASADRRTPKLALGELGGGSSTASSRSRNSLASLETRLKRATRLSQPEEEDPFKDEDSGEVDNLKSVRAARKARMADRSAERAGGLEALVAGPRGTKTAQAPAEPRARTPRVVPALPAAAAGRLRPGSSGRDPTVVQSGGEVGVPEEAGKGSVLDSLQLDPGSEAALSRAHASKELRLAHKGWMQVPRKVTDWLEGYGRSLSIFELEGSQLQRLPALDSLTNLRSLNLSANM